MFLTGSSLVGCSVNEVPRMTAPPSTAAQARQQRPAAIMAALAVALVPLLMPEAQAANPNALWEVVHGQCVPDQEQHADPRPCAMVALRDGVEQGYAVLKDRRGKTQFLLIPTARINGIEDPELLKPDAPNYFAAAWQARTYVDALAHRTLSRESISLAVNSMSARSQNQLHIHIDCVRPDVRDALREHQAQIGDQWTLLDVPLAGHRYRAMRVMGEQLGQADPFKLLADGVPGAREEMGRHTLVVIGATFADGGTGFIVLDDRTDGEAGGRASGEALQDHACALAGRGRRNPDQSRPEADALGGTPAGPVEP